MFIAHEQEKDGYISPKGDKRCISPILDNCDFVVYLTPNGIDDEGNVIPSTGHLAQTDRYFARSRFDNCATTIDPYTAENLEKIVKDAIEAEEASSGIEAISYEEQKAMNTSKILDYDELMDNIAEAGQRLVESGYTEVVTDIVESILGAGKKVSACNKKQIDAMAIILDELLDKTKELGL